MGTLFDLNPRSDHYRTLGSNKAGKVRYVAHQKEDGQLHSSETRVRVGAIQTTAGSQPGSQPTEPDTCLGQERNTNICMYYW